MEYCIGSGINVGDQVGYVECHAHTSRVEVKFGRLISFDDQRAVVGSPALFVSLMVQVDRGAVFSGTFEAMDFVRESLKERARRCLPRVPEKS